MPRFAGPATLEVFLHIGLAQRQARRTPVYDAAQGRAVTLTESRQGKHFADRVTRHNHSRYDKNQLLNK
jgi:hypothetical protein